MLSDGLMERHPMVLLAILHLIKWVLRHQVKLLVFTASLLVALLLLRHDTPSPTCQEKLTALSNVQSSLEDVYTFVQQQKKQLVDSQAIVEQLESKHNKLKQVVSEDENVVNAILDLNQERQRQSVWLERIYGFLFGIASSLTASILIRSFSRKHQSVDQP